MPTPNHPPKAVKMHRTPTGSLLYAGTPKDRLYLPILASASAPRSRSTISIDVRLGNRFWKSRM